MSHPVSEDRILELAYGELSARDAREVEEHVRSCETCRSAFARIADTRRLMSALPEEPAPSEGERILVAAAREAARGPAAPPRRWLSPRVWGASAAIAAVLAAGAVSYRLLVLEPRFGRDDPDALAGGGPYERAEPPRAAPEPPSPEASAPLDAEAPAADLRAEKGAEPHASESRTERPARSEAPEAAQRRRSAPRPAGPPPADVEAGRTTADPPAPAARPAETYGVRGEAAGAEAAADASGAAAPSSPRSRPSSPAPPSAPSATPSEGAAATAPAEADPAARPSRSAEKARRAAGEASAPASDAVHRYDDLRRAGALAGEIQTFPGCEGESWRKLERDPEGRVVKYVRVGVVAGRRLRIEHVYGRDGELAAATVVDLDRSGTPLDADALGLTLADRAEEADGAPRCDR